MIKIMNYADTRDEDIFCRMSDSVNVTDTVAEIIQNVITNKDKALFEYCRKFDKAELTSLEVSQEEIDAAFEAADPALVEIIKEAAVNIEKFHRNQVRSGFIVNDADGMVTGQKVMPLGRVGLYVPGGTAAYPSSVLMNCIPAKIAGVPQIVMVTPASGGSVNPVILVAAKIAGVDKIFKLGGAQAVAALAYGTETVPKVDKIVGPGNAFVAEAKRQVFGLVSIDMIAGPSEILVIADKGSDPKF
ncbi:MAG: histidinol dehydrogenase, partial [Clostridia bacterium]|nr:histidinol dehydrogenase [Clostridia bacterium]